MPARNANYDTMNHEARRRSKDNKHPRKQLNRIYKRDKGICQICFEFVPRTQASRDHIKEFALCTDEEARSDYNVRLAHILCNLERHRRLSSDPIKYPSKPILGKSEKIIARERAAKLKQPYDPLTFKIAEVFPDFSS